MKQECGKSKQIVESVSLPLKATGVFLLPVQSETLDHEHLTMTSKIYYWSGVEIFQYFFHQR